MFLFLYSFRPNIVLKGSDAPFIEDTWRKIAIGPKHDTRIRQKESMDIKLVSKCARCLVRHRCASIAYRERHR